MNDRSITECDWCHKDVITSMDGKEGKNGIDILRPFQASFESFLGVDTKHGASIVICKDCATRMANYIKGVIMENPLN